MPISDFKAFLDKYLGKGTSVADIAKAEGITEAEANEAKQFMLQHIGFKPDVIVSSWNQMQYSKAHLYQGPAVDPNAVKTPFGTVATQKTIAMLPENDFWIKMNTLVEAAVSRVLGK